MAEAGEEEHPIEDVVVALPDDPNRTHHTAYVLPGGDEHPHWCKCQRVCGGDQ